MTIKHQELKEKFADYVTVEGVVKRRSKELQQRKKQIEESIAQIDSEAEKAKHILQLFADLDRASKSVGELKEKIVQIGKKKNSLKEDFLRNYNKLVQLNHEMGSRRNAVFTIFRRSIETITKDIVQTGAKSEQQKLLLRETETLANGIVEQLSDAQREHTRRQESVQELDKQAAQKEYDRVNDLREPLVSELRGIDSKIASLRNEVLKNARVVGATCTKTSLSIKDFGRFDVVIIDEVSMVIPPLVWLVAGLSLERVVLCGDSCQIPPIVPTNQQEIFDVLGKDVLEDRKDESLMLEEQYRMEETICDLIKWSMYKGKLKTSLNKNNESCSVHILTPFDQTFTIVDTSDLWPFETVTAFKSRFNLMHALLARNLAWHLCRSGGVEKQGIVGICTPYAAQAKLIEKLLEGEKLGEIIQAGTVHLYQGDERHMMVLDIPESHGGGWGLGQFVQGLPPEHIGARLLNVAVSRAEQHLAIIANVTYLDKRLPSSSLLRSIIFDMQKKGRTLTGRQLLELRPIESDLKGLLGQVEIDPDVRNFGLFDESNFDPAVKADMMGAKQSIIVFSGFVTPQRVAEFGDLFRLKVHEGVKVRCVTRPPYSNGTMAPELGKDALDALEGIGCIVDCRSRIHQKVVLIDNEIVWHGSLNVLSHSHRTEESMTRMVNKGVAEVVSASMCKRRMSAKKAASAAAEPENPRCNDCGARTVYAEGRYGPYFYCENQQAENGCRWSVSLDRAERGGLSGSVSGHGTRNSRGRRG